MKRSKTSMMKIGLTYTGSDAKHDNYVRWLKDHDDAIEVIRLSVADDPNAIKECDALVLSGGVDIEPTLYGGNYGYEKAPKSGWQKDRDLFEYSALLFAWEHAMPVMGVCRGLQLINVNCKGTLVQDLGFRGDETHEAAPGEDKQHPIKVTERTLLADIAGQGLAVVNSAHHQAIDRLGVGLSVNSRAEDGTIEGIEWADPGGKPFMIAVQWHPERMYINKMADALLYRGIRDRFIAEIKKVIK